MPVIHTCNGKSMVEQTPLNFELTIIQVLDKLVEPPILELSVGFTFLPLTDLKFYELWTD
jgi:hypothetical protein